VVELILVSINSYPTLSLNVTSPAVQASVVQVCNFNEVLLSFDPDDAFNFPPNEISALSVVKIFQSFET
jgi:hypothetical protein